jgi:hypothetical protein
MEAKSDPIIKEGQIINFTDGTWAVSLSNYFGYGDVSSIVRYDSEEELLQSFPEFEREQRRAEIDRLKGKHVTPTAAKTTSEQMVHMFGAKNMTNCTEVTERLTMTDDSGWVMTRTYNYADGTSKNVVGEGEGYYCLVPATPGWIAATDSYYDGEAARDHHPIAMWRYLEDKSGPQVLPHFPGDDSMTHAVAVISPDGRVFEVHSNGCLKNDPYPSVKAWHDHVARKRAEHLAEEERKRLEREDAERSIVFRDGRTLAEVRKEMAEEGFMVVPERQDRCNALDELPF